MVATRQTFESDVLMIMFHDMISSHVSSYQSVSSGIFGPPPKSSHVSFQGSLCARAHQVRTLQFDLVCRACQRFAARFGFFVLCKEIQSKMIILAEITWICLHLIAHGCIADSASETLLVIAEDDDPRNPQVPCTNSRHALDDLL